MSNIIFMGTPDFSTTVLEMLIAEHNVIAVVTQPDRPVGRKKKMTPPPVKEIAVKHGLPVYQPEKLTQSEELAQLIAIDSDFIVTAAFGQLLPESLLEAPKLGAINVHASLLPKYIKKKKQLRNAYRSFLGKGRETLPAMGTKQIAALAGH